MAAEGSRGSGRWMRVALAVSLAINLAVAGVVAGAALRDGSHGDRRHGGMHERLQPELRELGPLPIVAALAPDERRALMAAAQGRGDDLREPRETLRRRFEEMLRLLREDPFDAAAMSALLAEQRAAAGARLAVGEALLVERYAAMTPEARRAYADRLDSSLTRRPGSR